MEFVGRNSRNAHAAFGALADGVQRHGITDGRWSLIDGVRALLDQCGPCDAIISTWTAASADLRKAQVLLRDGRLLSLRLLVDRSFETRQPEYCRRARAAFGDDAIRVWSSHAKFTLLLGGRWDILYLTSANLNRNARLENYSIFVGGPFPREYLALVEDLWAMQKPGEAFDGGARVARHHTEAILERA